MPKNFKKKNPRKNSSAPAKRRRTALHATLFAITAVLLLLVLLIVELRPVRSVSSWASTEESIAFASIVSKVFVTMNQRNRASEFLLLNFTPAEVNALTAMALRMYANNKKVSDPPVYAVWNTDGTLNTECSIKYAGVYFNIYTRLVPSVSGGKIHLQIINCRLGKLPLSAKMAEKAVNSRLNEEICKDKRLQKSLSLIYSLQAEKSGEVQVKILRKNSGKLLKSIF